MGKGARNGVYAAAHAPDRVKTLQKRKKSSFFMWTLQIENMNVRQTPVKKSLYIFHGLIICGQ